MESNNQSEISELKESLASLKEKYDEGAKIQDEMQEKVDNVKFIVTHTSADKKLKNTHKKELEQYKKMRKIDLIKNLNGKKYSITIKNKIIFINWIEISLLRSKALLYRGCLLCIYLLFLLHLIILILLIIHSCSFGFFQKYFDLKPFSFCNNLKYLTENQKEKKIRLRRNKHAGNILTTFWENICINF